MRTLAVLFVLMLFVSASFAAWQQSVNVLAEDQKHRPIPHTKVTMTWQVSERDQTHEDSAYTDYMGIAQFNLTNYVQLETQVDYTATAQAEYGAGSLLVSNYAQFDVRAYADPVAIPLPLYRVNINAVTPSGKPVPGATVYIAPWTRDTDQFGTATFLLPQTDIDVVVAFAGAKASSTISVSGDSDIIAKIGLYRLTIRLINPDGTPRLGAAAISNKIYPSDSHGYIQFDPFPGTEAKIVINSGGMTRELNVEMTNDRDLVAVFDSTPPRMTNFSRTELPDGKKTVFVTVIDEGEFASGLANVSLYWQLDGVEQTPIEMYLQSAFDFAATIPPEPDDVVVSYYIKSVDNQGNSITSHIERYGVPKLPVENNQSTNGTGNQTSGNQTGTGGNWLNWLNIGQINWWLVIGVGAVLIIAIVAYIYIRGD